MPAAGASSRMGAWKPLLPWGEGSVVEAAVGAALGACPRVLLVAGFRAEGLEALFRGEPRVLVLRNPGWELGMLGSIQRALPEVRGEAFFCANADMPLLAPADYEALAERRASLAARGRGEGGAASEAAVFAAAADGTGRLRAGHPVLVPAAWIAEVLGLPPGDRMQRFLAGRPSLLVERGPAALADIDTPGDYEAALRSAGLPRPGPGAGLLS